MAIYRYLLIFLILLSSLFSNEKERVNLYTSSKNNLDMSGFIIAQKMGFYKEYDIYLDIKPLNTPIQNLYKNTQNYFLLNSTYLAQKELIPNTTALLAIYKHSDKILLSKKESLKDLENQKIAYGSNNIENTPIKALFANQHIHPQVDYLDSVTPKLLESNYSAIIYKLTDLKKSSDYKIFSPHNFGINIYDNFLLVSKKEQKEHKIRVSNFYKASKKGWEYIEKNPDSAKKILELDDFRFNLLKTLLNYEKKEFGVIQKSSFEELLHLYRVFGFVSSPHTFDKFVYEQNYTKIKLTLEQKEWLQSHQNIRVGVQKEYAPIEYIDSEKHLLGITSSYLNLISKELNLNFELVIDDSEKLKKMLENRQIDMITNSITFHKNSFPNSTKEFFSFPTVVVTNTKNSFIKSIKELEKKIIVVEREHFIHQYIKTNYPKVKLFVVDDVKDALKMLYKRGADAYIGTLPIASRAINEMNYSNLNISGELKISSNLNFFIRDDWQILTPILNKLLDTVEKKRKDEIYEKWVKINYKEEVDKKILWLFLAIFALIFIITFLWNRRLEKEIYNRQRAERLLKKSYLKLKQITQVDQLTKIPNRKNIESLLETEIEKASRHDTNLSISIIDINNFSKIGKTFGYKIADTLLVEFSHSLKSGLRKYDIVGKFDTNRFILISPHTKLEEMKSFCERVKISLEGKKFCQNRVNISISFGFTSYEKLEDRGVESILNRALNSSKES